MNIKYLDGKWKIRWSDGQRGGAPHYNKEPHQPMDADLLGMKKEISDLYDETRWIDAKVPGEVHLDLWNCGIIDNPYIESNVLKARWVEECMWYYRKVFDAPLQAEAKYSYLKFDGIDYGTIVYLNGHEIARHENAFYPLIVDVSGLLKKEGNVLVVRLESGLYTVSEKNITHLYSATMGIDNLLHKRMWLRKPQFSATWDWSQRLLNVGIHKSVSLLSSDDTIIVQSQIRNNLSEDLKKGNLEVRFFTQTKITDYSEYTIELKIDGNIKPVNLIVNDNEISAGLALDNPKLWYPAGYGNQNLYEIEYTLFYSGKKIFSETKKTGFRFVEVDQSPHPEKGNYFIIKINGIKVFAKGANFVPADMILASIDKERYDKITDLALKANFNFLRIWGGGIYENEEFFELCDNKGILVWHDFISACATLPYSNKEFAESIRNESVYNVRRLSCYPSLVVWCGNNEVDVYGVKDFKNYDELPEDTKLYFEDLPQIVSHEDPEKYYQPSSPYSFDGSPSFNDFVGDQHPWSVGFLNKDHRDYYKMHCRFPNEGGILGPVGLSTINKCIAENQRYVHSFQWDIHDNMLESWQPGTSADENIKFWLDKDVKKLSVEDYVYAGGAVQSEGLTAYIDNFRSRKFDSAAAVFWMYNDCWPTTISWTIIDYYLNPTPSFHSVRRAFSPLRAIVAKDGNTYFVVVNNDTMDDVACSLRVGNFSCNGKYYIDEIIDITVPANSKCTYFEFPNLEGSEIFTIPFAVLYDKHGNMLSQNRKIDSLINEIPFSTPDIKFSIRNEKIVFESEVYVMGVCIDLEGDNEASDNIFDLFPNIPYSIENYKSFDGIKYTMNDLLK